MDGYDLVSGHWYSGPNEVLVPTGFLTQTGTSFGDTISLPTDASCTSATAHKPSLPPTNRD